MTNKLSKEVLVIANQMGMGEDADIDDAVYMVVPTRALAFATLCEVHAQMGYGFEVVYSWNDGLMFIRQDNGPVAFASPCSHPDNSYHVMYYTQG